MYEGRKSEIEDESLSLSGLKELTNSSNDSRSLRYGTDESPRETNKFDFAAARRKLSKKIPVLERQSALFPWVD